MRTKELTLSVVIPVYNEEGYIRACLESIARQTEPPDEVIVVDNNSTDNTAAIAREFPFVKLVNERRQGLPFARNTGIEAAKGDIVGRIDGDAILPGSWAKEVKALFDQDDVVAVTGGGIPYDVPLKRFGAWVFKTYHEMLARLVSGHVMLWGSNMALRKSAWVRIRGEVHNRNDIWEDYDLSFHVIKVGRLVYGNKLSISCSYRSAHKPLLQQLRYQFQGVRVFYLHTSILKTIAFTVIWSSLLLLFPIAFIDRYLWQWKKLRKPRLVK